MNGQMNGDRPDINGPTFPTSTKYTNMKTPPPAKANVFVCESSGTIDDGFFAVRALPTDWYWQNAPATRHGNGGSLSFADGHAEFWRWLEPTTAKLNARDITVRNGDRDLQRFKNATGSQP